MRPQSLFYLYFKIHVQWKNRQYPRFHFPIHVIVEVGKSAFLPIFLPSDGVLKLVFGSSVTNNKSPKRATIAHLCPIVSLKSTVLIYSHTKGSESLWSCAGWAAIPSDRYCSRIGLFTQ